MRMRGCNGSSLIDCNLLKDEGTMYKIDMTVQPCMYRTRRAEDPYE